MVLPFSVSVMVDEKHLLALRVKACSPKVSNSKLIGPMLANIALYFPLLILVMEHVLDEDYTLFKAVSEGALFTLLTCSEDHGEWHLISP